MIQLVLKGLQISFIILFSIGFNLLYAQPANDNCFGAISLTPSANCIPVNGTVANATQSLPGCQGVADDDVWYSFVANQNALGVQVSGVVGFNPVIQVFSGGCSSSTALVCANTSSSIVETTTLTNLVVGVTYWIRIYHFAAALPTNPNFTICITPQAVKPSCTSSPPAGNTCAEAVLICDVNGYCGSTSSTYTSDSWAELNAVFCGSIQNNSFIKFVAEASTVSFNVWVTTTTINRGIQILIFTSNNCSGPVTPYACISPLEPTPNAQSINVSGLTPGVTYFMMIDGFDGDVCDYVIGANSGIQVSGNITTSNSNICLGSSATLTASGGNGIYTWSPNPDLNTLNGSVVIATPKTEGPNVYTMTTTSLNPDCPSVPTSITITAFAPPAPNAGVDDTVCFGDPIFLNGALASSSNSFLWQFNTSGISPTPSISFLPNFSSLTPTVTVNQPGLYKFILRETSSVCGVNRDTVLVLVQRPQQTLTATVPSCFGVNDAQISVNNPDADEYSFDNGTTWQSTSIKMGLGAGKYSVCSRNYIGCNVCSEITIVNPPPIDLIVSKDTTICQNGTANISAQGSGGTNFLYHWNHTSSKLGNQAVQPVGDSVFVVFVENEFGCQSLRDSIFVSVNPPISGSINSLGMVCPGNSVSVKAVSSGGNGGPYNFVWSTDIQQNGLSSEISVSPSVTSTYTVTISDDCESTPLVLTQNIVVLPLPIPEFEAADTILCEPAIFTLVNKTDPSSIGSLQWNVSNGQSFINQESITTNPLSNGTYNVQLIVTSPQGCIDSVTYVNYLISKPQPQAEFSYSPLPVKMFSPSVLLSNGSSNADSYMWFIDQGNPAYSEDYNVNTSFPDGVVGSYPVTLIALSDIGCSDTVTKIIPVVAEVLIYAPNSFTPDNDEFNQQWRVFMEGIDVFQFNLKIYNRWGQIIFESKDPDFSWDGTYQGNKVETGVYTWTIEAKELNNDDKLEFRGHINVLK